MGSPRAGTGIQPGLKPPWQWPRLDRKLPGERRTILLVTPVFTHVFPEAHEHFQRLVVSGVTYAPFDFAVHVPARKLLHGAMNDAAELVMKEKMEGMIVMDDDCLPKLWRYERRACGVDDPRQFQVIPRLLGLYEENRGDVIAGVGYMRGYPHTTTVGRLYKEGMTAISSQHSFQGFYWLDDLATHAHELDDQGLLDADFCGFPIVFIPRKVLEGIKWPAFGTIDEGGGACTHDVYFCNKVRRAGFRIKVDTWIDCGHIIQAPVVDRFTRPFMKESVERATKLIEDHNARGTTPSEPVRDPRERESDPAVA